MRVGEVLVPGQLDERARADSGEEHDHVELAVDQASDEFERLRIADEGNFAKGWRGNRAAAVIRNQR